MGSQRAALIISFDSHFICFYVEVDKHMFHSLGHHKYDMHHKHYSLLVMTAEIFLTEDMPKYIPTCSKKVLLQCDIKVQQK
jgi:hypothetical protein